jgi:hypothetical protein
MKNLFNLSVLLNSLFPDVPENPVSPSAITSGGSPFLSKAS